MVTYLLPRQLPTIDPMSALLAVQTARLLPDTRRWLEPTLVGSSLLLILTLFVGGMHFLLAGLGDEVGARVALGALLVTGIGFLAGQILMVSLLALAALKSNMEGVSPPPGHFPL